VAYTGNGEWIWVEKWMGKYTLKAKVTPIVPRWIVMAAQSWWFPGKDGTGETRIKEKKSGGLQSSLTTFNPPLCSLIFASRNLQ